MDSWRSSNLYVYFNKEYFKRNMKKRERTILECLVKPLLIVNSYIVADAVFSKNHSLTHSHRFCFVQYLDISALFNSWILLKCISGTVKFFSKQADGAEFIFCSNHNILVLPFSPQCLCRKYLRINADSKFCLFDCLCWYFDLVSTYPATVQWHCL